MYALCASYPAEICHFDCAACAVLLFLTDLVKQTTDNYLSLM
jgi:hypothetical protein